jgi:hypothetical protein
MIARGVLELKLEMAKGGGGRGMGKKGLEEMMNHMPEIHQFLDGFYMSRIGIRMLIGGARARLFSSPRPARNLCLSLLPALPCASRLDS